MKRLVLVAFGRLQRPVAWFVLVAGAGTFVAVLLDVIATGDFKTGTLLAAALVFLDGFGKVQEVENELNSAGAVDE